MNFLSFSSRKLLAALASSSSLCGTFQIAGEYEVQNILLRVAEGEQTKFYTDNDISTLAAELQQKRQCGLIKAESEFESRKYHFIEPKFDNF